MSALVMVKATPGPFGPAGWYVTGWNNTGGTNFTVPGLSMAFSDTTDDIVLLDESQAYPVDDYNNTFGYIAMTSNSFYLDGTLDYRIGADMSWLSEFGESDYLYAVLSDAGSSIDYYGMYLGLNSANNGLIWTNHNVGGSGTYSGSGSLYSQGQFSAVGNYKLTLMFKYDGYIYNPSLGILSEGLSSLDIDTVYIEESAPVVRGSWCNYTGRYWYFNGRFCPQKSKIVSLSKLFSGVISSPII